VGGIFYFTPILPYLAAMFLKSWFIQTGKNIFIRFPRKMARFFEVLAERNRFSAQNDGRFTVNWKDLYPCLADKLPATPFDQHYTYHPAWAARILAKTHPTSHTDFSSILWFGTMISAFIPVKFYDYRPANLTLSNWSGGFADLCKLDIESNSLASVSCMHTVEHIGLGRYGDALDPLGDVKACAELVRITQPGGDILFVTPVGSPRIEYNAHRVYSFELVEKLFEGCALQSFSLVPDTGGFIEEANPELVALQQYGCGCFWFKKNKI
jgi:hypothetical protein